MKISLAGIPGLSLGKHNLKDPRLDQADKLVEADKKTYAQVDLVDATGALEADAVVTTPEGLLELIFKDLELIETRLGRNPTEEEKLALEKLKASLEAEKTVRTAGLSEGERQALAAHRFLTDKPVLVAGTEDLQDAEPLLRRAFAEAGYICFLTVGGKENRAWPIRCGATAWEAAGAIHTDIQKGFIRAEIIRFEDFLQAGGETQAKRAGKLRLETKQYVMQDYDLTNFRFNK
jgi:ribosome-binding ATPase YchF (GTP1/OBG family)